MKSWMWLVGLVVAILVVFAVMAAVRPRTAEAPLMTEELVEDTLPGGQPIQLAPTVSPEAPTSPAVSESPAATTATISISDTGFSPATVRVKVGTTVTFVNNGQAAHQPVSNPHPVHTDLPGFAARKGLVTGEEYLFVFTKVGTWGFHDHLNTALRGSVVVE